MNRSEVIEKIDETFKRRHLSPETKKAYVPRILQYIDFCKSNAWLSTEDKIISFLSRLAKQKISPSTQNIALNAIVLLYRDVLRQDLGDFSDFIRAKAYKTLPTVFSEQEALKVISYLPGVHQLLGYLLYGCGFRLNEVVSLRIKDIDFDRDMIFIRHGKGAKDRAVMLPRHVKPMLQKQVEHAKQVHAIDIAAGHGKTYLPNALAIKFPNAATELAWQWVFPARKTHFNKVTGETRRWSIHHTALQKAVRKAIQLSGINKKGSCHTFRHSFATHLLENGKSIHDVKELLGHRSIKTTMIYIHVMKKGPEIESPLDAAINHQSIAM